MEKHKNTAWGGVDAQKSASYIPLSHRCDASDTGNAVQDLGGFGWRKNVMDWCFSQDSLQVYAVQ